VSFYIDEVKYHGVPHLINSKDSSELEEYIHARHLIERRYDWPEGKLGGNPVIIRFQIIEDVIDG